MHKKEVLNIYRMCNFKSEWDVSVRLKTNFAYIQAAISELLSEGQLTEVGSQYNERFGKLFKIYSAEANPDKYIAQIANRQRNTQLKSLATKVLKLYEEFTGTRAVESELKMIQEDRSKADLQFHQLSKQDFINVYGKCIELHNSGVRPTLELLYSAPEKDKETKHAL